MAETEVSICAKALALLGVPPISGFTEEPNGPTCEELYPTARDALLAEYPWRFIMEKSGQLGKISIAPKSEWKNAFELPTDRVGGGPFKLFLTDAVGASPVKDWSLSGDQILTNYEKVFIDYRVRAIEAAWPAHFIQLMVYEMAWILAEAVTEDGDKVAFWFKITRGGEVEGGKGGYYRTATQSDAMGDTGQQIGEFTLLDARMGAG